MLARIIPTLSRSQGPDVALGPGDDAALLNPTDCPSALTTDCLVEDTHFRLSWLRRLSPELTRQFWRSLGWKVMAINLSDLAAMGCVRPSWALVTAGLPASLEKNQVHRIHQGLTSAARRYGVSVIGGDTVRAPNLFLSVAMGGFLNGQALLRSGARPGHRLGVTGTLGEARAALEWIEAWCRPFFAESSRLVNRFFFPTPRLQEGRLLGETPGIGGLIDISDGLWRSLEILSQSSEVGYAVDAERLPASQALKAWGRSTGKNPFFLAAAGGEDYELLFSYPPEVAGRLRKLFPFTEIGEVLPASRGKHLRWAGKPVRNLPVFEHF